MFNYRDFEYIKTITNLNEVVDVDNGWTNFYYICDEMLLTLEIIKYCIENGADLNIKDIYNETPFHLICNYSTTKEVLEYCLENGADLNIKNQFNRSPFYYLCYYNKDLSHYMGSGYTG